MIDFVKKLNEGAATPAFKTKYEPQLFYAWTSIQSKTRVTVEATRLLKQAVSAAAVPFKVMGFHPSLNQKSKQNLA